ncbi:Nif-specific ferredoxin III [Paraburkholderia youngii]
MSEIFCVKLPSGEMWTPTFVSALDDEKCIGCGRCFRACSRGVLQLVGVDEGGALLR